MNSFKLARTSRSRSRQRFFRGRLFDRTIRTPVLLRRDFLQNVSIRRQREQRPGVAIHVVFQIENLRKTGAGRFLLGPGTVFVLRAGEILDAALQARTIRIVECAEAHDRPRGLCRGARSLALENRIVVGVAAFAPAAVLVLDTFEPVASLEQPRLLHIPAQRTHPAQDLPGAVNVVDSPPAIPGAVLFLMLANKLDGFFYLRIFKADAFVAEQ